mmetsp:Transcript_1224/g.3421  ORF Transcript_1224/g.3421 Transcript_1224/m.3421 type:complete len:204 (+) Transcript_1224:153-764(+)
MPKSVSRSCSRRISYLTRLVGCVQPLQDRRLATGIQDFEPLTRGAAAGQVLQRECTRRSKIGGETRSGTEQRTGQGTTLTARATWGSAARGAVSTGTRTRPRPQPRWITLAWSAAGYPLPCLARGSMLSATLARGIRRPRSAAKWSMRGSTRIRDAGRSHCRTCSRTRCSPRSSTSSPPTWCTQPQPRASRRESKRSRLMATG